MRQVWFSAVSYENLRVKAPQKCGISTAEELSLWHRARDGLRKKRQPEKKKKNRHHKQGKRGVDPRTRSREATWRTQSLYLPRVFKFLRGSPAQELESLLGWCTSWAARTSQLHWTSL
mmetsp:Transcript_535/g.1617  ORF Transcript_535/g.1617 Transcript_535/m.1617 type:complete len:118 (-) Transcript_535:880-1233(-)